ncbi:CAF17-like 4Fe-4S cluster assembly/insertion protein YgfZ [Chelatococcus reniformis]|uniref:Folate-binding protein n=1 Tax=Chelatococcus reniformis TaxID=1494448 RepID=A0A916U738_9HYPH|nr:folate-binding protein YgfZ [Chelatococcus reniformis]GGC61881.1 folate-binding protein [Chelatococcus reniformis]
MPITHLADRGVIEVGGPEAATFLQNLVTCNIDALAPGRASLGALLAPQGKILFDFLVVAVPTEDGPRYLLDVAADKAAELAKRLGFYKLRAKVTVTDRSATLAVAAAWGDEAAAERLRAVAAPVFADPRLAALGWRAIGDRPAVAALGADEADSYHAHRIALGIPEGGKDYAFADAFPHEADMDQLGGVDFAKGCYVGQEVVSRMQHRGTARTRIVAARLIAAQPVAAGSEIVCADTRLGTLVSASGAHGLALVRLDRLGDALTGGQPITAAGVPVAIEKPAWATFPFPTRQPAAAQPS